MPVKTEHHKQILDPSLSEFYYQKLKSEIPWFDGIYSIKHKVMTRKAYIPDPIFNPQLDWEIVDLVNICLSKIFDSNKLIYGIYLNYYRDGKDWAPAHSHPGQTQFIISLGTTRRLKIGTKEYSLDSGDVIIFGSSVHELLKDESITEGRISIAVFLEK